MNVRELIKELQKVDFKDKEVYIYIEGEIFDIDMVDLSISDRVDINIKENKGILEGK